MGNGFFVSRKSEYYGYTAPQDILRSSIIQSATIFSKSKPYSKDDIVLSHHAPGGGIQNTYYEYRGIIHIHTTYSDGGGSYPQIAAIADSLGLDFLIPSDHNTIEPLKDGMGGYYGNVLMIPAVEHSTDHGAGHFLAIGDSISLIRSKMIPSDSVYSDALEKENMIFLAHVFHPHQNDWENWNVDGYTGMEIFNLDENWRDNLTLFRFNKLLASLGLYGLTDNALNYSISFPEKQLRKFDELCSTRKIVGIGSTDAHSKHFFTGNYGNGFPSYASMFKIVQAIIISTEPLNGIYTHDKHVVLKAIRNGHVYTGFPGFGRTGGFLFSAHTGSATAVCGDSLYAENSADLEIRMPLNKDVLVQVVKDGEICREYSYAQQISFEVTESGVYRVQVLKTTTMLPFFNKQHFPLILSNPIYIRMNDSVTEYASTQ